MPTSERYRSGRWVAVALAALVLVAMPAHVFATAEPSSSDTVVDDVPASTPPEPTESAPTESTPTETAPAETAAPTPTVPGEEPDVDATAITWIAVIAAGVLVGVAVWWMVRSSRGDGPVRRMDDDWPTDSEVI